MNIIYKKLLPGLLGLLFAGMALAVPIERIDFATDATELNFDGLPTGTTSATDGVLTVSGGQVELWEVSPLASKSYYDAADTSPIRMDFSILASAVGLDFIANNKPTTLSVFDALDNLIESFTIQTTEAGVCDSLPCGFIGIDAGANLIAYAIIDTPLSGNELYVDNIIYQSVSVSTSVPEPGTLLLLLTGLSCLIFSRKTINEKI